MITCKKLISMTRRKWNHLTIHFDSKTFLNANNCKRYQNPIQIYTTHVYFMCDTHWIWHGNRHTFGHFCWNEKCTFHRNVHATDRPTKRMNERRTWKKSIIQRQHLVDDSEWSQCWISHITNKLTSRLRRLCLCVSACMWIVYLFGIEYDTTKSKAISNIHILYDSAFGKCAKWNLATANQHEEPNRKPASLVQR